MMAMTRVRSASEPPPLTRPIGPVLALQRARAALRRAHVPYSLHCETVIHLKPLRARHIVMIECTAEGAYAFHVFWPPAGWFQGSLSYSAPEAHLVVHARAYLRGR